MGIFGDIMSKIFGQSAKAETPSGSPSVQVPSGSTAPSKGTATQPAQTPTSPSASTAPSSTSSTQPMVDIKAVLSGIAKSKKQKLKYDKSIVDLLKLLDLDSSLTARQKLAKELGYSGDTTKGSSKMNVWLHKEVMRQLAANGGKVPKKWME